MSTLVTKRFVMRKSLIGNNTIITFTNKKNETYTYDHDAVYSANQEKLSNMVTILTATACQHGQENIKWRLNSLCLISPPARAVYSTCCIAFLLQLTAQTYYDIFR